MELLSETNVVVSFFSYILFRLPNLLNLMTINVQFLRKIFHVVKIH